MSKLTLTPTEREIILRMLNFTDKTTITNKTKSYKINDDKLTIENGWFTREQIEYAPRPYSQNKRWDYLDKSLSDDKKLIITNGFTYRDKKNRKKSRKVYKLSPEYMIDIQEYFYTEKDQPHFETFIKSDYYKSSKQDMIDKVFMTAKIKNTVIATIKKYMQDNSIISPSFITSLAHDPCKERVEICNDTGEMYSLINDYGFIHVYRSFLMYDAVNCANPTLRKQYFDLITQLSKIKKIGGNKV